MKVFINGVKTLNLKNGTIFKPLIGIDLNLKTSNIKVSGVYHNRIGLLSGGRVLSIVFGKDYPKYAIFFYPRFPFIALVKSSEQEIYAREEK